MAAGQYVDVPALAQTILDGVVAHFDAAGVELPDRRVIAPGETRARAWDCAAVVLTLGGIAPGQAPGVGAAAKPTSNPSSIAAQHAVFSIQIIRAAADVGTEPGDDDKLTESGLASMRDAALLFQALQDLCSGPLRKAGMAVLYSVESLGPTDFTAVEGGLAVTAKDRA